MGVISFAPVLQAWQREEAQRVAWQEECESLQDAVQKLQSAYEVLQGRLEVRVSMFLVHGPSP